MPPIWLATYWPYYSSSQYYSQLPVEDEDQYAQALGNFASQHGTEIADDESDGDWVDQDGNTWSGDVDGDPQAADNQDDDGDDDGGDDDDDDDDDDDSGDDDDAGDDGGDDGGDDD